MVLNINKPEKTVVPTIDAITKKELLSAPVSGTFGTMPFNISIAGGIKITKFIKKHTDIIATKMAKTFSNTSVLPIRKII